jgi:putative transposase
VSACVAWSRELVAKGYALVAVARVLGVTPRAIYRTPKPRRAPQRWPVSDPVDLAIVDVAQENPADGYRMVWALSRRKLGQAVNRGRVLRVMREQKLIQRRGRPPRWRRSGVFRVTRPAELWHMDMTSIWVAEHGWVYLNAIIDCCTREILGWEVSRCCRAKEAIAVIEQTVTEQGILPGTLALGTDNGSAFTARATRLVLGRLGVTHRRGGYRDPESQALSRAGSQSSRSA